MELLFSTIPGIIMSVGGIIVVCVIGYTYVMGLLKKNKDGADDRLINILQGTVKALEEKVDKQKEDHDAEVKNLNTKIDTLTKKVSDLESENETLVKVLQGRDEQTKKFYEAAFESMKTAKETHALVVKMAESIINGNKNVEELIKVISKHADIADHSITAVSDAKK